VEEAKHRLSEVLRRCAEEGPQVVTRHGKEVAVVISWEEYRRIAGVPRGFKEFLLSAPDLEALEIQRAGEPAEPVYLE
jgi:prevent-host-death family protein